MRVYLPRSRHDGRSAGSGKIERHRLTLAAAQVAFHTVAEDCAVVDGQLHRIVRPLHADVGHDELGRRGGAGIDDERRRRCADRRLATGHLHRGAPLREHLPVTGHQPRLERKVSGRKQIGIEVDNLGGSLADRSGDGQHRDRGIWSLDEDVSCELKPPGVADRDGQRHRSIRVELPDDGFQFRRKPRDHAECDRSDRRPVLNGRSEDVTAGCEVERDRVGDRRRAINRPAPAFRNDHRACLLFPDLEARPGTTPACRAGSRGGRGRRCRPRRRPPAPLP